MTPRSPAACLVDRGAVFAAPGRASWASIVGAYRLSQAAWAKKRGTSAPIDALQTWLFNPLDITRIRRARSLLKDQAPDEARYRISVVGDKDDARLNIAIANSVMRNQQPLVPVGYGQE